MKMTNDTEQDLPKAIAGIMVTLPSLTLRTGWAYLKMKKRAQKMSKVIERKMVSEGMPEEMAGRLADEFASGISVHRWMREMNLPFGGGWNK